MIKIEKNRIIVGYEGCTDKEHLIEFRYEEKEERLIIIRNRHKPKPEDTRSMLPKFTKDDWAQLKLELMNPEVNNVNL